jgi:hypothetical protein
LVLKRGLKAPLLNLAPSIVESGAEIAPDPLPSVMASETPLIHLFKAGCFKA